MSGWFQKKQRHSYGEEKKKRSHSVSDKEGEGSPRLVCLTSDNLGTHNPLDWANVPLLLQVKFPHWKEQTFPSPTQTKKNINDEQEVPFKKTTGNTVIPDNTIPYIVMDKDTLVTIALKFDTTPAEIARVNKKIGTTLIHPGELLYIPDCSATPCQIQSSQSSENEQEKSTDSPEEKMVMKNDDFERGRSSSLMEPKDDVSKDHICVSAKFMSEQLCVLGCLLLNTQSVMFQPDIIDPLVEDNGREPYEVLIPISEIVHAYLMKEYTQPGMNLKSPLRNSDSTGNSNTSRPSTPPPPFSHSSTSESDESHTYNHQNIQETDQSDLRTNNDTLVNESDSTKENEFGTVEQNQSLSTTNNESESVQQNQSLSTTNNASEVKENESESVKQNQSLPTLNNESEVKEIESESVEQNQSLPTTNIESEVKENESVEQNQTLPSESETKENEFESEVKDGNESFEVKNLSKSSSNESEMDAVKEESDSSSARTGTRTRTDTLNSESLYPESEKEIQASSKSSFEEIKSSELNFTAEEVFWYFLYIRVSQSSQQSTAAPVVGIEIPLKMMNSRIHSPGIQTVRTWFIFAIPKRRVEDLHQFLFHNHPSNDSANYMPVERSILDDGCVEIINVHGSYSDNDPLLLSESHYFDPASSWEIYSVRDIQPPRINCMDVENNLPLPTLVEPSDLLDIVHIRKLMIHLLGNAVGHDWYPVYSTFKHGFSLSTMYRNMLEFEGSPVLLVVQDSFGKLFGAMVPSHLRVSDRFYGTGESFLFSFDENNEMQIFRWTGANDYVVKGSIDSIAFGSGDGYFGLWLDQSLYRGSSSTCTTYNNEHLGTKQDFIIHGVEAWGFV